MAWQTVGTTNVTNTGNTVVGYVYLQYDNASTGTNWNIRLVTGARSGYSFSVNFINIVLDGASKTNTSVTQNSVVFATGSSAGSRTVSGSWTATWSGGNKNYSISGTLPAKGSAPEGGSVSNDGHTWDSVTFTSYVTGWGSGPTCYLNRGALFTGSANGDMDNVNTWSSVGRFEYYWNLQQASKQFLAKTNTADNSLYSPIPIKGLLHYKLGFYLYNGIGETYSLAPELYYLPPAAPLVTYTESAGSGQKTYTVSVVGSTTDNHTTYDADDLTRYIRYKVDNDDWVVVANNTTVPLDTATTFTVTVYPDTNITVEAYMTYHGEQSETTTLNIYNGSAICTSYGSAAGLAEKFDKALGSVSDEATALVKIYGSVNGVARKIYDSSEVI